MSSNEFGEEPFYMKLDRECFRKGDVLKADVNGVILKVLKVYKLNWWKKLLMILGFKFRSCEVKVIRKW